MKNYTNHDAARMYLERRGYEIVDEQKDGYISIVAREESTLVFVRVTDGFDGEVSRKKAEDLAFSYFAKSDEAMCAGDTVKFRFDVISIRRVDDSRAMIRHHINALSIAGGGAE